jgi:NAD(P)-dependent dehydrogenase (short-subunit alcohol dehydrogenase family)
VNAILPGPFLTDVSTHWDPSTLDERAAQRTLKRIGAPDEIVGAALFFASSASSYCAGALLRVDGGAP